MNKISAVLGTVLVLVAGFLFLTVFSGGSVGNFTITGQDPTLNFMAFLFVIVALPVGAGLAFYGYAVHKPAFAAAGGQQVVYKGRSGLATVAVVLAIIAILIGLGAVYYASTVTPSSSSSIPTNVQSQLNAINSKLNQVSGLANATGFAAVNATPTTIPFRVDWCNTDNTGEDRFCPQNLVVTQGDTVQIIFMHNDTDAHTFTMLPVGTSGYSFQINLTYGAPGETTYGSPINATFSNGMHNFITNGNFSASCSNNGTFAQQSAGISGTLCVSGSSLLAATSYNIAINPIPSQPLSVDSGPILINVTNQAYFPNVNISAVYAGLQPAEAWGIGAFQATTPGIYEYFCHYHVSNGMFGYLIVLPNAYCQSNAKACGNSTA